MSKNKDTVPQPDDLKQRIIMLEFAVRGAHEKVDSLSKKTDALIAALKLMVEKL